MAQRNSNTQTATEAPNGTPKRPFREIRCGALKAVVWKNETRNGVMFSTQLVRVYKDEAAEWRESHSLGFDDLLSAGKLLDTAHTVTLKEMQERAERQRNAA